MKKIALVFYGQLRNVDICYPYWKTYVIDPLYIKDVYIHTWQDRSIKEFNELFNPKTVLQSTYENAKQSTQWFTPTERIRSCVQNMENTQYMYYGMYKAMSLIDDNADYDYVILSRIDNIFVKPIRDNLTIHDNEIFTSTMMFFNESFDGKYSCVCDWFAIGNVTNMKKFASIGIIYKQLYDSGVQFHPETLLGENLKILGITAIPAFNYVEDHYLIRDQKSLLNL